jgi:hypothetical protein
VDRIPIVGDINTEKVRHNLSNHSDVEASNQTGCIGWIPLGEKLSSLSESDVLAANKLYGNDVVRVGEGIRNSFYFLLSTPGGRRRSIFPACTAIVPNHPSKRTEARQNDPLAAVNLNVD